MLSSSITPSRSLMPLTSGPKSATSTSGLLYPRLLIEFNPKSEGIVTRLDAAKWLALKGINNPCYQEDLLEQGGNKEKVFLLALNSMLLAKSAHLPNVLAWRSVAVTELRLGYNPQVGRVVSKLQTAPLRGVMSDRDLPPLLRQHF